MRTVLAFSMMLALSARGDGIERRAPVKSIINGAVGVTMSITAHGPAIDAMVNGQGPFHFILDTGTGGAAIIFPVLAQKLHLEKIGEGATSDPSGRNLQHVDVVRIDSITIGVARFEHVDATLMVDDLADAKIDGILGFPLFQDVLMTLDYPRGELRIAKGSLSDADGTSLPFRDENHIPIVDLEVGGRTVPSHIDSGSPVRVMLPLSLAHDLTLKAPPRPAGSARAASGQINLFAAELEGQLTLGAISIVNPTLMFNDRLPSGNLGYVFLRDYAITFDARHHRVAFAPATATPATAITKASEANAPNLTAYVGRFGERTISLQDGSLYLQRTGGPRLRMVPAAQDAFTLQEVPEARLEFVRENGVINALRVLNRAGEWETSKREAP